MTEAERASDAFWRARTEVGGGRVANASELPDAFEWRRFRLAVELTDRYYRRAGLAPAPMGGPISDDLYTLPINSADCDLGPRAFGRIGGALHRDDMGAEPGARWANLTPRGPSSDYPDGQSWPEWVDEVSALLGLDKLNDETGHDRCRHAQSNAAFPLMYRVGVMLRTQGSIWSNHRCLYAGNVDTARKLVGDPVGLVGAFDRQGRWLLLETPTGWCGLSPNGRAYTARDVLDLARLSALGQQPGDLAAAVEDLMNSSVSPPAAWGARRAADLARRAGLPTTPFTTSLPVPASMTLLADRDSLAVVVDLGESRSAVDSALAHGLAHAGDRDLHLVLPEGREQATCDRVVFLQPKIRVWCHDGYRITPVVLPARAEVLAALRQGPWRFLKPDESSDDGCTHEATLRTVVLKDSEFFQWRRAVRVVRTTRTGRRPVHLANDLLPDLVVVETAVDPDEMFVLRALDQWAWATANLGELQARLGRLAMPRIRLMLVVGDSTGEAVLGPNAAAQREALDPTQVRSHVIRAVGTTTERPSFVLHEALPVSAPPVADPRRTPSRWPLQLRAHLRDNDGMPTTRHPSAQHAILSQGMPAYEDLRRRGQLHHAVLNVVSSQAFAINLFGPAGADGAAALLARLGLPVVTAEPPVFEYTDPLDRLREASDASAHLTQVDVLLRGTTADGLRIAALIEVKLTEDDFGECSAHQDPENPRRSVCRTNAPFGGDPTACFQMRSRDEHHSPRRYAEVLTLASGPTYAAGQWWTPDGGCPFRTANQQMRNAALATELRRSGEVDHAVVTLCAPAGYAAIWRRWGEARRVLESAELALLNLPAEAVLDTIAHPEADVMRTRYRLLDATAAAELTPTTEAPYALVQPRQ